MNTANRYLKYRCVPRIASPEARKKWNTANRYFNVLNAQERCKSLLQRAPLTKSFFFFKVTRAILNENLRNAAVQRAPLTKSLKKFIPVKDPNRGGFYNSRREIN